MSLVDGRHAKEFVRQAGDSINVRADGDRADAEEAVSYEMVQQPGLEAEQLVASDLQLTDLLGVQGLAGLTTPVQNAAVSRNPISNFRPRPYPRHTAGVPVALRLRRRPILRCSPLAGLHLGPSPRARKQPEIFIPNTVFPPGSTIATSAPGLYCQRDEARQLLVCQGQERRSVTVQVRVRVP